MQPVRATASKNINAPVEQLYKTLADDQSEHPLIPPRKYFPCLDGEEGGFGEGTIVRFQLRLLGWTRSLRALVTESQDILSLPASVIS